MQEAWDQSLGQEDPPEKEMAAHSSILAWDIHGQRRFVDCSPWGYKKVRHDLDTEKQQDLLLYIILLPVEFNFIFFFPQLLISFSNLSKLNAVFGSKEYLL